MDNAGHRPSVSSALCYKDPKAALKWLEEAFGFEPSMVILGPNDELMHSEMQVGDGIVMIGSEWSAAHKSPKSIDGFNTQTVHVHLNDSVDAHCERARKAGAVIQMEPTLQFYGDRAYRAVEFEVARSAWCLCVVLGTEDEERGTRCRCGGRRLQVRD
jgi:uncharacterized glyoxalase superfamily protein PhnB